jgi:hypothetical protein
VCRVRALELEQEDLRVRCRRPWHHGCVGGVRGGRALRRRRTAWRQGASQAAPAGRASTVGRGAGGSARGEGEARCAAGLMREHSSRRRCSLTDYLLTHPAKGGLDYHHGSRSSRKQVLHTRLVGSATVQPSNARKLGPRCLPSSSELVPGPFSFLPPTCRLSQLLCLHPARACNAAALHALDSHAQGLCTSAQPGCGATLAGQSRHGVPGIGTHHCGLRQTHCNQCTCASSHATRRSAISAPTFCC